MLTKYKNLFGVLLDFYHENIASVVGLVRGIHMRSPVTDLLSYIFENVCVCVFVKNKASTAYNV